MAKKKYKKEKQFWELVKQWKGFKRFAEEELKRAKRRYNKHRSQSK
jgi:hypothetical protein